VVTTIDIQVNDNGLGKIFDDFPATKKVILSRAINRTAAWSRTRTLEAITQNLALKKSDLDGSHRFGGVTLTRANPDHLEARVNVSGSRIPLIYFHGTPNAPPSPRGIAYQIDAGGGRKRLTLDAFVAVMSSEHTGFFKRKSEGTTHRKIIAKTGKRAGKAIWSEGPLIQLYGPSIPQVAENQPAFQRLLEVDAGDRLALQVDREMNFVLTGNSATPPPSAEDLDG
jgi:hypothetical protein